LIPTGRDPEYSNPPGNWGGKGLWRAPVGPAGRPGRPAWPGQAGRAGLADRGSWTDPEKEVLRNPETGVLNPIIWKMRPHFLKSGPVFIKLSISEHDSGDEKREMEG